MIDRFQLFTSDGVTLEARRDSSEGTGGCVVFCHPHPLQGGTMMAPLMVAVTSRLVERGFDVLRFNFRGTGSSEGSHDGGHKELLDIDAAVAWANQESARTVISGWSFGGAASMNWLSTRDKTAAYAVVAPPPELLNEKPPPGPGRIILGRREQVVDSNALLEYASLHSIDVVLTSGDHFFHGRGKRIGDLIAQALS